MKLFGIEIRKIGSKVQAPVSRYTSEHIFRYSSAMTVGEQMSNSTVNACVGIISDAVATLPLIMYRRKGDERIRAEDSTLYHVLKDRPDAETTPFTFKKQIMLHLLLKGNAFIYIGRRGSDVTSLTALDPESVEIKRDTDTMQVYYEYHCDGITYRYTSDTILHIPAIRYNGLRGIAPLEYCSKSTKLGLKLDDYTDDFFSDGIHSKLLIKVPADYKNWKKEDSQKLSEAIINAYGGVSNSHKPFIMSSGMDAQPLNLSANTDSQLVENRAYSSKEIAKIFRVPLTMLGETGNRYNSNEQEAQNFLQHTLTPWLILIQEYLKAVIPLYDRDSCYFEFDTNTMLRADSQVRTAVYQQQINNGMLTLNDVNRMENRPLLPAEVGDVRFMPVNLMPLTKENIDAYMSNQKQSVSETDKTESKTDESSEKTDESSEKTDESSEKTDESSEKTDENSKEDNSDSNNINEGLKNE